MAKLQSTQMLEEDDLGPADIALLDMLREGRITAPFAAEEAGYSTQYVRDRLRRLVEHGNATKVYEGLYELVEDPRSNNSTEQDHETRQKRAPATNDTTRQKLREELAGSGDSLEARVDEVLAMYSYLQQHGEAEKDELLNVVDVEATGYASASSVWANMVKGKDTLRALPGVEKPGQGLTTWTYSDE